MNLASFTVSTIFFTFLLTSHLKAFASYSKTLQDWELQAMEEEMDQLEESAKMEESDELALYDQLLEQEDLSDQDRKLLKSVKNSVADTSENTQEEMFSEQEKEEMERLLQASKDLPKIREKDEDGLIQTQEEAIEDRISTGAAATQRDEN